MSADTHGEETTSYKQTSDQIIMGNYCCALSDIRQLIWDYTASGCRAPGGLITDIEDIIDKTLGAE